MTGATRMTQQARHTPLPSFGNGDEQRRANLRRMRLVATSLLVLAAIIFVLTHGRDGVWGYVNAASEAGMVGAVADWFAETALFRQDRKSTHLNSSHV